MAAPVRREDATSEIVFVSDRGTANPGEIYVLAGRAGERLAEPGCRRVWRDQDGSHLLYERSVDWPHNLWAVDADGTNLRRLTPLGGPSVRAPACSADGKRLVYTSSAASACGFCYPSLVIATPDGQMQSTVPGIHT